MPVNTTLAYLKLLILKEKNLNNMDMDICITSNNYKINADLMEDYSVEVT